MAYIGALMQLEREGLRARTVSTVSAGTLVGALYCAGVTPAQMLDAALRVDLRRTIGDVGRKPLRRLWTLLCPPYNLYPDSGIGDVFRDMMRAAGKAPDPRLGQFAVPLSTAAVDVAGKRILVYTSAEHPDMPVDELLRMAVAIPLMHRPYERDGHEIMDASVASHAPIWLAAGQREDLPIVVLRTVGRRTPSRWVAPWFLDVLRSGVMSRDTFELGRQPRTTVHDIVTDVDAYASDLSKRQVQDLVELGQRTVADAGERTRQEFVGPSKGPEGRAAFAAGDLFSRHLDRLARERKPTVFLSYAHEDTVWVERLRSGLGALLADTQVDLWDDSYIPSGSVWRSAIEDAIDRARVAVLFISEHFHSSDFIRETELELLRAAYRSGRLRLLWLPIDGALPAAPEQALQALHDPNRPLASLPEIAERDAMAAISRDIEHAFYAMAATVHD